MRCSVVSTATHAPRSTVPAGSSVYSDRRLQPSASSFEARLIGYSPIPPVYSACTGWYLDRAHPLRYPPVTLL